MRVILILPYSSLISNPDLYGDGYHVRLAKEIWKRSHKYQLECWRPERMLKQEISGEKDGIVYRAFPSWRPSLGKLTSVVYKGAVSAYAPIRWGLWREYSPQLLKALEQECSKGDTMLLLHHIHFDLNYQICLSLGKRVPIIGYHIGGKPYAYNIASFLYMLPYSLLEKKALANVDAMLTGTEWHYEAFRRFYRDIPKVVYPIPVCVDFDFFKPMDKMEARRELGIDPNKKVIIHVGRFDKAKGFDAILDMLPLLGRDYPVELIAIGGTKGDMLYDRARNMGVRAVEWVSQQEIAKYYSAADVYLFPKFYAKKSEADSERFMGAGLAPVEAMGCGLPVIGTNLKGFYATQEEMKGIGGVPKNVEDALRLVCDVFEHPMKYDKCRQVAMKYYSWQPVVDRILGVFDELNEQYYGGKS